VVVGAWADAVAACAASEVASISDLKANFVISRPRRAGMSRQRIRRRRRTWMLPDRGADATQTALRIPLGSGNAHAVSVKRKLTSRERPPGSGGKHTRFRSIRGCLLRCNQGR
jgi:hypothetical protein